MDIGSSSKLIISGISSLATRLDQQGSTANALSKAIDDQTANQKSQTNAINAQIIQEVLLYIFQIHTSPIKFLFPMVDFKERIRT